MEEESAGLSPLALAAKFIGRNKILLIISGISFLSIIGAVGLLIKSNQPVEPIRFETQATSSASIKTITVDIEGAVAKPGIYNLLPDARVSDAIRSAGGLTAQADRERIDKTINRAAKLVDGAKLYFPKIGELSSAQTQTSSVHSSPANIAGSSIVNINLASQADLEALPGVGPVTAKKIVDNRPYQTLEELVNKKAVGQSLYAKIKDLISL